MSDFAHITEAIVDARLTEEQLLELNHFVVDELKEARRREARKTIQTLRPGDTAKVVGKLRGEAYLGDVGEVIKINRTTVTMKFEKDHGTVRIPAWVLEEIDG